MRNLALVLVVVFVLLAGCVSNAPSNTVTCDPPFVAVDRECCIDSDDDGTCNKDEPEKTIIGESCDVDFDCSQTGTVCNAHQTANVQCISNECVTTIKSVECCSVADCPVGFYCDANYLCAKS